MFRWIRLSCGLTLLGVIGCAQEPTTPLQFARHHHHNAEWAEAIGYCDQHLQVAPDDIEVLQMRGQSHLALGQFEAALADFTRILEVSPDTIEAYYFRAMVYRELGEDELAFADRTAAMARDPKYHAAYEYAPSNFAPRANIKLPKRGADAEDGQEVAEQVDERTTDPVATVESTDEAEPGEVDDPRAEPAAPFGDPHRTDAIVDSGADSSSPSGPAPRSDSTAPSAGGGSMSGAGTSGLVNRGTPDDSAEPTGKLAEDLAESAAKELSRNLTAVPSPEAPVPQGDEAVVRPSVEPPVMPLPQAISTALPTPAPIIVAPPSSIGSSTTVPIPSGPRSTGIHSGLPAATAGTSAPGLPGSFGFGLLGFPSAPARGTASTGLRIGGTATTPGHAVTPPGVSIPPVSGRLAAPLGLAPPSPYSLHANPIPGDSPTTLSTSLRPPGGMGPVVLPRPTTPGGAAAPAPKPLSTALPPGS